MWSPNPSSKSNPGGGEPISSAGLGRATVGGAAWVYLTYALGKLLTFGTTVVLARLLTAGDFGLVGYALIVVNYLEVVKDLGVGSALIAYPSHQDSGRVRSTAFVLTALFGAALAAVAIATAPLAELFFGVPSVAGLTRVLALSLLISSLGRTHDALLQKEMGFRRRALPDLAQSAAKGLVSITLALLGFGAWSLAWGQVAGATVSAVIAWVVFPWRPALTVDRGVAGKLIGFGGQLAAVNLVSAFLLSVDYLLVGRMLGTEALGLYTLAFRLPDMLLITLCWVLSRVLFPVFTRLREDGPALRAFYLAVFHHVALVVIPLGLGLVAAAPSLVLILFGERWMPAVLTLQLLTVYSTLHALYFHAGDAFKALGRGAILIRLSVISAGLLIPAMIIGLLWAGLPGVAAGWIAGDSVRLVLNVRALRRQLGVRLSELGNRLRSPVLAGLTMFIAAWGIGQLLGEPAWTTLVAQVLVGATIYALLIARWERPLLSELRALWPAVARRR